MVNVPEVRRPGPSVPRGAPAQPVVPPGPWQSPDGRWWPADSPPYRPASPPQGPGWWQAPDGYWYGPNQPPYWSGIPAGAKQRRAWVWITVGIGTALLVVLFLIGLNALLDKADFYHADLTKGSGDFRTVDQPTFSTRYEPDGYHVVVHEPQVWVPASLEAPTAHSALTVEVLATPLRSPEGAGLGPWCWQDSQHGFGLLRQADTLSLDQDVNGRVTVLAQASAAPWSTGRAAHLLVSCTLPGLGSGEPRLVAYVDGRKVLTATATVAVTALQYTGFVARTAQPAPAEWVVSQFWRRGPGGGVPG